MNVRIQSHLLILVAASLPALGQPLETVKVVAKPVLRSIKLPGEFLPFESVDVYARVTGFVDRIAVDRGTAVKKGDLLAEISAPEMKAQRAEAKAKIESLRFQRAEALAKQSSEQATLARLVAAARTSGAIAENEIDIVRKNVEAAQAGIRAIDNSIQAAVAAEQAFAELESYLKIKAPFDGVVTERRAHPGALAGPAAPWLVKLEQLNKLRLVVAVPESESATIANGSRVTFTVPAYPARSFSAVVARFARSVDPKSRTMPVELDVANPNAALAPGMFPEVDWPVRRPGTSLLVPPSAIVTTTERSFVVRVKDGTAEWVDVRKGNAYGPMIEVTGSLREGDFILKRATDEIRNGSKLSIQ